LESRRKSKKKGIISRAFGGQAIDRRKQMGKAWFLHRTRGIEGKGVKEQIFSPWGTKPTASPIRNIRPMAVRRERGKQRSLEKEVTGKRYLVQEPKRLVPGKKRCSFLSSQSMGKKLLDGGSGKEAARKKNARKGGGRPNGAKRGWRKEKNRDRGKVYSP